MLGLAAGLFGLVIGSFLNVLIFRQGEKGLGGRSECRSCGTLIRWYDNVPVLSWILLRGRCRACHARISVQYPLVELSTALLFVGIAVAPLEQRTWIIVAHAAIAGLLIAIAVYDLRHRIIPDPWVYTFAALALLGQLLITPSSSVSILLGLLAGPIVALPLFGLWFVSRGTWMGFGDVKFALGMGWLLGPLYGMVALFFAFVLGAIVSIGVLLPLPHIMRALEYLGITRVAGGHKGFTIRSEVPFGPFLVASTLIVWFMLMYSLDPLVLVGWW